MLAVGACSCAGGTGRPEETLQQGRGLAVLSASEGCCDGVQQACAAAEPLQHAESAEAGTASIDSIINSAANWNARFT